MINTVEKAAKAAEVRRMCVAHLQGLTDSIGEAYRWGVHGVAGHFCTARTGSAIREARIHEDSLRKLVEGAEREDLPRPPDSRPDWSWQGFLYPLR